ncbi:hypothetical protein CDPW8_0258 [Corynebacterium diphtheriae PW8]|nr:hypothetical protein CDPW8_0258 [Corynebacterium diphtheriae PW8]
MKDGVPVGKAEQSYRVNGDSITIQARFPALLAGKYTAILEGKSAYYEVVSRNP